MEVKALGFIRSIAYGASSLPARLIPKYTPGASPELAGCF